MTLQRQIDRLVAHRASEWLEILRAGKASDNEAFVAWITESPRNMEEFMSAVAIQKTLRGLDVKGHFDIDALLRSAGSQVASLREERARPVAGNKRSFSRRKWAAAVAVLFLGAATLYSVNVGRFGGGFNIETAVGEQRTVELPDGSLMHVNARSEVEVRFNETARIIRLVGGEALFKVSKDTARPFQVRTRDAVVQALGTEFNVYAKPQGTAVVVLEGAVNVSADAGLAGKTISADRSRSTEQRDAPAMLLAGQALRVDSSGIIERKPDAEAATATAWRQRRLVFDRTPLEQVVEEFNRYNTSLRLRLVEIRPGSHHYSGNFDADDPESLGTLLSGEPDLTVERGDHEIVIRRR